MEEDIDIYDDLSISHEKSVEECKKCSEWETKIGEYKKKVQDLQKVNRKLEVNMSSLLLTAKAEVARKDRMIADLRRQLDDASFRRGRFNRNFNSEPNEVQFGKDRGLYNPNIPPPSLPEDFKTVAVQPQLPEDFKTVALQPQLPVNFKVSVPPPPLPENDQFTPPPPPPSLQQDIKDEDISPRSPDNYDEAEYICKPELYLENEEEPEQKYEEINSETLFTKRLRKRLEIESELEKKEKERIVIEEAEKKENERLRLEEAQRKENERLRLEEAQRKENERLRLEEVQRKENEKLRLEEAERKENEKLRLEEAEKKENERLRLEEAERKENERFRLEEAERKENERLRLEEAERTENETLRLEEARESTSKIIVETKENQQYSVSTSNKRPREYEKPVEVKRLKFEPSNESGHDDFREDWSDAGAEPMKIKKELESLNFDYDKKCKEIQDSTKVEAQKNFALRLYHLAEGLPLDSTTSNDSRKDFEKRKEEGEARFKDTEMYENSRYENNKYKDKFLRERYEKDKCKEKLEKQRHEKDKYKREKEKFEREKFDRKFEKNRNDFKRSRRSISYSPEKNYKFHGKRDNRQKGFTMDQFHNTWRGRGGNFKRKVDLRQKIYRFAEQESKHISDNYKFRMGREINKNGFERNRRNSYDRCERERELEIGSMGYKSRSNSKEKATRETELRREAFNSARSRSNSKENTRRDTGLRRSCNFERSRSNSKETNFTEKIKENFVEKSGSNSIAIDQRMEERKLILEKQKAMLEIELRKFDIECSKSSNKIKELEEGELSDSSQLVFPSLIHETKQSDSQKLLDNSQKKIVDRDLEKTPVEKFIENLQVEKENKIENMTNKFSQEIKDSKSLSLTKVRIAHKPEQGCKKIKGVDSVVKNEIPNITVDTKLCKPTEKNHLNQFSEINSCTKLDSKLVVKPKDDLVKHIETLDSFIESAKQVLEENKKEGKKIGEISKKVGKKKLKKLKSMKDLFSPVKEREQLKRIESKELENEKESSPRKRKNKQKVSKEIEEGEILSPVKENTKKRDGKQVFNPVEDTESIEQIQNFLNEEAKIGETEIRKNIKEDIEIKAKNKDIEMKAEKKEDNEISVQKEEDAEIKTQKNDYQENTAQKKEEETKTTKPLKELNPLESKKEDKISSPVKEKKKKRSESKKKDGKQVSNPVESTESTIGQTQIKKSIKEDIEIKVQKKEVTEDKTQKGDDQENKKQKKEEIKTTRPLKELNPPESKNEDNTISSPVKERKKQKRSESKKRDEKQVSNSVDDTERIKQKLGEADIKTVIKEDIKIKELDKEATKIKKDKVDNQENTAQRKEEATKTAKCLKEFNPSESKKGENKISSQVKGKRDKIELESEVSANTSSSVRKPIQQEEVQPKLIECQKLREIEPKQKEIRKPIQKVKEVVPEKPKTKKTEEKPKKAFVVIVRKRKRPPVLSDCNASTTIVSNENVIKNINLNNNQDKNLLSKKQ